MCYKVQIWSPYLRRREFLNRSLSLFAVPAFAAAASSHRYSTRTIDLVGESNVIDMLGLLTLNWSLLDQWHRVPAAFTAADFQKLRSSGIDVFHPAVAFETGPAYDVTRAWFGNWNRFIAGHPDYFLRVNVPNDLAQARLEGRIGIILGMQDANHLRTLDDVDAFYGMGQRLTQLTYNSGNQLGGGCKLGHDAGLTPFGAQVVARMNSVGMAIDVSHCGQRTSLDAIAASRKPVLITHANCRALAPGVARCKPDDVIRAAARSGGVLGITAVRQYVKTSGPVTIEDVLDHFDHAVKLVGVEHVGVGSDFDLDSHPSYDIPGLNHSNRIYELTEGLLRRGYTSEHVSLILGGNFERALRQIWLYS
jgi:membrane dipeptidase